MPNLRTTVENTNQRTVSDQTGDEKTRHTLVDKPTFPKKFPHTFSKESNLRTVQDI